MHGIEEAAEDIPQLDLEIEDIATLGNRMAQITLEYVTYMHRLESLLSSEIDRVEKIEAFFGRVFVELSEDDYLSVHLHHRVFTTIKVQYRLPHLLDLPKRVS